MCWMNGRLNPRFVQLKNSTILITFKCYEMYQWGLELDDP